MYEPLETRVGLGGVSSTSAEHGCYGTEPCEGSLMATARIHPPGARGLFARVDGACDALTPPWHASITNHRLAVAVSRVLARGHRGTRASRSFHGGSEGEDGGKDSWVERTGIVSSTRRHRRRTPRRRRRRRLLVSLRTTGNAAVSGCEPAASDALHSGIGLWPAIGSWFNVLGFGGGG